MWIHVVIVATIIIRVHTVSYWIPHSTSMFDYLDSYEDYEDFDYDYASAPESNETPVNIPTPNNYNNTFNHSSSVNITEPYLNQNNETDTKNNEPVKLYNNNTLHSDAGSRVNNTVLQNNNTDSPVNNLGTQNNNTDPQVNHSGTQHNKTGSRVNNSGALSNNTDLRVNNSGTQNNNTDPQVNNSGSLNNNTDSRGYNSGTQNNNTDPRVNNSGSQNNNTDSRVNNSGTQTNNTDSRVNNSGTQTNNTDSRGYNSGTQNNNTDLQVNNSGSQNNNTDSRVNYSGTQTNNTDSRVNYSGTQTNNTDSRVNNFGTQNNKTNSQGNNSETLNNKTDLRLNNSGTLNNNTKSRVNTTGLQNINLNSRLNNATNLPKLSAMNWKEELTFRHNNRKTSRKKGPIRYDNIVRLCPNDTVCPRKCCKLGENFDILNNVCSPAESSQNEFIPPVWNEYTELSKFDVKNKLKFSPGHHLSCLRQLKEEQKLVTDITKVFRLRSDGKLEVESPLAIGQELIYDPGKYCIDMFIMSQNKTKLNAFICHVHTEIEKYHLTVTGSCYLVTCFFVVLRVSLFAWLPELQTLHGVTIIAYLGNFVVGYMLLGIKKLFMFKNNISRKICVVLSVITYFSIMSAFFWRNIMCFDMWKTFSGKNTISRKNQISRPRLAAYFAYAFGVPAGLTAILIGMEFSDISKFHPLKPKLRLNGCAGMSGDGALVYHFTPLITLFFANIVMFTSTALKIAATTKQTKILYQSQNNVTNAINTERQRFLLYVKLWAAMLILEVNWIVRAVVYFFPEVEVLVFFVDIYNTTVLLGIIIHYFCQKRNWKKIKRRYQQMRGIAVSEPNTGTSINRTTSTISLEVSQTSVNNTVTSNCDTSPL